MRYLLPIFQTLVLFIILALWQDKTVADMMTSQVLPMYFLLQLYINWDLIKSEKV